MLNYCTFFKRIFQSDIVFFVVNFHFECFQVALPSRRYISQLHEYLQIIQQKTEQFIEEYLEQIIDDICTIHSRSVQFKKVSTSFYKKYCLGLP